ncbi:hypothetical protein ACKA04_04420 [Helcococcus kunzii]|uniref:hypothetical protein n=1 Tax=Helcococcus kunzii TaxID=40091 RepID=UPI00389F3F24
MNDFVKVFTDYSYQWIVGLFFAFLSYIAKKFYTTYKQSVENQRRITEKESEEQRLIKFGMLAILRFRVNRLCSAIKEQGFMTLDEKIDLDDLYIAYEKLGGNSRTHELYEYTIKNYKIKDY